MPTKFRASVEAWRALVQQRADADMPIDSLMAWLDHESGGNPCSTGIIKTDGTIVEAGIAQTYHPDDDRFGATVAQLRASCTGTSQTPARALTSAERELQVKVFLAYVRAKRDAARKQLADVGADWPESSADFWALVKLQHALPGLPKLFLPAAKKKLGRAPASWKEFRATVDGMSSVEVRAVSTVVARWFPFDRLWTNAEKVGKHAGPWLAGGINSLAFLLGLLGLGWLLAR